MKVSGDWLEGAAVQDLLRLLADAGHQAYPVGGCVRNAIFGVGVADVDIATDALPRRVMDLAEGAGMRVVPTGIEHGTVTVISRGEALEVTTFRRDVETDGRRATVAFADRIEEDAMRRDFTMNALYARADGTVLDPTGEGIADALSRRIRFVGEAEDRIREDYLRILRFFRFLAWYGDPAEGPDPDALSACAANSAGIETLSRERLGAEMRKLLAAPDPAPALAAMSASGVLARVLPGADPRAIALLVWLEGQSASPARWIARLALLGGEDVADRLRLSKAEARDLTALREALGSGLPAAALGWKLGAEAAASATLARAAALESPPPEGWKAEVARGAAAEFPLSAADLMPGLSGPALGARLRALQQLWLESGLSLSREALLGHEFPSA